MAWLAESADPGPASVALIPSSKAYDTVVLNNRKTIVDFALRNRFVAVFPGRACVESGGLLGYGPDLAAVGKRAAAYSAGAAGAGGSDHRMNTSPSRSVDAPFRTT
jgi:hypothetical protein